MKQDLSEIFNLYDIEQLAAAKMPRMAYEYVASGAADELTMRWNREAFDTIKLNASILNDVSKLDTRTTLFGDTLAYPILIAPTAFHKTMHPEGELATARGANAASTIYVISSYTTTPLEEITQVATQPLWFQMYVRDDRDFTKDVVLKAEALGCRALCITVDTPVAGVRNRQDKAGFALPDGVNARYSMGSNSMGTLIGSKPLTWDDMAWLISLVKIPVLLKGIMNPEDAEKALQIGASGVIVSNHGGRNLDTVPATIDVLPRIAERVHERVPILLDGGIRRGTDILKALALGANAVLVGKPICFGLGAAGVEGVTKVLEILQNELLIAMSLTGQATIAGINPSVIWR